MRAFSLVELMVALTIAAFLLLGLMQYGHHTASQYLRWRAHQEAHANLLTAHAAFTRVASLEEGEFWDAFPLANKIVHAVDHAHGGKQFTKSCPDAPAGGCTVIFDIQPVETPMVDYRVEAHDWPNWIHPTPLDDTLPLGPGEEIQPQSVIWIQTSTGGFPVVVGDVAGDRVYPIEADHHPWVIPAYEVSGEETRLMVLGQITLLHVNLTALPQRQNGLRYQPWRWDGSQWRPARSRTGDTHLVDLVFDQCGENLPDRIILVTQPRAPQPLPQPLRFGTVNYQTEVFHATIAF